MISWTDRVKGEKNIKWGQRGKKYSAYRITKEG